ncbi:MAG: hypothetical protein O2816_20450 [Planctomycetota bacterium]|nr:hypothetical protein [Planctomycetota bacterium]
MHVPSSTPVVSNPISVAVAKLQLDGQAAQGAAAKVLIEAAGEVTQPAPERDSGVGRRVDVEA